MWKHVFRLIWKQSKLADRKRFVPQFLVYEETLECNGATKNSVACGRKKKARSAPPGMSLLAVYMIFGIAAKYLTLY